MDGFGSILKYVCAYLKYLKRKRSKIKKKKTLVLNLKPKRLNVYIPPSSLQ